MIQQASNSENLNQITSYNAKSYLLALVRSHALANAAYVAHTIPGRPPGAPIIWATREDDWLFEYIRDHHTQLKSLATFGNQRMLAINLQIALGSVGHPRKSARQITPSDIRSVLMVPVRGLLGDQSLLVVSTDDCATDWQEKQRAIAPNLILIAQYVHHQAMVEAGIYNRLESVHLSPREAECLHWTASGKTVEDIATIVNISPRVTRAHLDSARRKLNASNIAHAVARAVSLGLVAAG
jgi:DNA-binding CsgD family transcriptional regulator